MKLTIPITVKQDSMYLHTEMGRITDIPDRDDIGEVRVITTIPPSHVVIQVCDPHGSWVSYEVAAADLAIAVIELHNTTQEA